MNKKIKILLLVLVGIFCTTFLQAHEKLSNVSMINVMQRDVSTLECDLVIQRTSDKWSKMVNGTFEFCLDTNLIRDYANTINVEVLESQLPENVSTGDLLPSNGYIIDIFKYDTRVAVTVLGPPDFLDCIDVPRDTTVLIAKLRITALDGALLSRDIQWMKPYDYYQALAYKTDKEITFTSKPELKYYANDNIPMLDEGTNEYTVDYFVNYESPFDYELAFFEVDYNGRRKISIDWKTNREIYCEGYTIVRFPDLKKPKIARDTIYTMKKTSGYYNSEMISKGISEMGFEYGDMYDAPKYGGGNYCYELYGHMNRGGETYDSLLATDCAPVPVLLIASAEPSQNPFDFQTTVKYELLDAAYVTVEVYDAIGKKVVTLTDDGSGQLLDGKTALEEGYQYVTFKPEYELSQGMYNIVIRGIPVEESHEIEEGYVDVKVQLLKDGRKQ